MPIKSLFPTPIISNFGGSISMFDHFTSWLLIFFTISFFNDYSTTCIFTSFTLSEIFIYSQIYSEYSSSAINSLQTLILFKLSFFTFSPWLLLRQPWTKSNTILEKIVLKSQSLNSHYLPSKMHYLTNLLRIGLWSLMAGCTYIELILSSLQLLKVLRALLLYHLILRLRQTHWKSCWPPLWILRPSSWW